MDSILLTFKIRKFYYVLEIIHLRGQEDKKDNLSIRDRFLFCSQTVLFLGGLVYCFLLFYSYCLISAFGMAFFLLFYFDSRHVLFCVWREDQHVLRLRSCAAGVCGGSQGLHQVLRRDSQSTSSLQDISHQSLSKICQDCYQDTQSRFVCVAIISMICLSSYLSTEQGKYWRTSNACEPLDSQGKGKLNCILMKEFCFVAVLSDLPLYVGIGLSIVMRNDGPKFVNLTRIQCLFWKAYMKCCCA